MTEYKYTKWNLARTPKVTICSSCDHNRLFPELSLPENPERGTHISERPNIIGQVLIPGTTKTLEHGQDFIYFKK